MRTSSCSEVLGGWPAWGWGVGPAMAFALLGEVLMRVDACMQLGHEVSRVAQDPSQHTSHLDMDMQAAERLQHGQARLSA